MKDLIADLYEHSPKLTPHYIRDVLQITDERAAHIATITGGIHRDEAEFLAAQVDLQDPEVSIEIGLGYGFSAMTICAHGSRPKPQRRHIVIDPHQTSSWDGGGIRHLTEAGFGDMVQLIEEPSYNALPRLVQDGLKVDFAFVDGWHTYDFVFVDAFYLNRLLKVGGVVAFDDADWPSVRPVIRYLVTNLGYEVAGTMPEKKPREPLDVELGLEGSCIALRKIERPDREIFFHKPFW